MGGWDNGILGVRTGYYTSEDGINWTEGFNGPLPGLGPGESGSWDHAGTDTVTVLHDGENYKLWYASSVEVGQSDTLQIGYATSPDGINWARHPEPVLSKGDPTDWDGKWIESPSVLKENNYYRMWYSGVSNEWRFGIGLATSSDGIHWDKFAENPVLSHGGDSEIDGLGVYAPSVIKIGEKYWMFYTALEMRTDYLQNTRLACAYSDDGIYWTKVPGAILEGGGAGRWDENGPFAPSVVMVGDTIKIYYTSHAPGDEKIGVADCEITFGD
jgi:sucrose-6-phosphate hydrolase SacC (GH32 family)